MEEKMSLIRQNLLQAGLAASASSLMGQSSARPEHYTQAPDDPLSSGPYQTASKSLRNYRTPQWLLDGKFGIYTHWGVYSVPAVGPNGTCYSHLPQPERMRLAPRLRNAPEALTDSPCRT
jgi:hypothetical protein